MRNYLFILVSLFMVGCASSNSNTQKELNTTIKSVQLNEPIQYNKVTDNGEVNTQWLKTFNDTALQTLVKEALENNRQISALQSKVQQANTLVKQAAASLKPTIGLGGQYSSRNALGFDEIYGAGLALNWEADIWGRLNLNVSAVKQSAQASQSDYEFARQTLVATTAKTWFMTTHSKIQVNYAKSIIALYEKELKIMEAKYEVGQVDKRSIHLAKANLSTAKNAYSKAQTAYENAQRSLELLLGRYPSALIKGNSKLTQLPTKIPAGMPSELLQRRPDLVAAQQRVSAAFYKTKEAQLLNLPRFTFSIGALFNNLTNAIADLGAGLFAPLYTGGAIEAEVEKATLLQKQSIEQYAQTALTAFKEVETALSLEDRLQQQEEFMQSIVKENKEALELTKVLFEVGKIEYLEVSQIQNKLISSEISLLDISNQRLFNRVNLHLALGGSFE